MNDHDSPSRRNRVYIVAVLVMLLSIGSLVGIRMVGLVGNSPSITVADKMFQACTAADAVECLPEAALYLAGSDQPEVGLAALERVFTERPELNAGCHAVSHRVGQRFYEVFGDGAAVVGNEWCGWGYYHGLMQHFTPGQADQIIDFAFKLCGELSDSPRPDCMHGIGHSSYLALLDIKDALHVCEALSGSVAISCADGVIMEALNASTDGSMPGGFVSADCQVALSVDVGRGCARRMADVNVIAGATLSESCASLTMSLIGSCATGFGEVMAGRFFSVGSASITADQFKSCSTDMSCASGFGLGAVGYHNARRPAEDACRDHFKAGFLGQCLAVVAGVSQRDLPATS